MRPGAGRGTPSQGPNTMALEDGSGPRASSPRCQTSPSEHRRNQLRTFLKPAHEVRPGAGRGTPSQGPNTMALEDGSGPRASSPRCQTSPSEHRRNQLRTFPKPALKCGPARVEGPLRRAQTPWPWRTDRARGPAAHGAKRHPSEHRRNQLRTFPKPAHEVRPGAGRGTPSQGPNTMALEDGSGPRASSPRCQTSPSEHRRNQLRTFPKPALKCGPARVEGPLRRA